MVDDNAVVKRVKKKAALYIEKVLYSISDKKAKLNNLEDLTFLKEVIISQSPLFF